MNALSPIPNPRPEALEELADFGAELRDRRERLDAVEQLLASAAARIAPHIEQGA